MGLTPLRPSGSSQAKHFLQSKRLQPSPSPCHVFYCYSLRFWAIWISAEHGTDQVLHPYLPMWQTRLSSPAPSAGRDRGRVAGGLFEPHQAFPPQCPDPPGHFDPFVVELEGHQRLGQLPQVGFQRTWEGRGSGGGDGVWGTAGTARLSPPVPPLWHPPATAWGSE